jgi:hypothetical protein
VVKKDTAKGHFAQGFMQTLIKAGNNALRLCFQCLVFDRTALQALSRWRWPAAWALCSSPLTTPPWCGVWCSVTWLIVLVFIFSAQYQKGWSCQHGTPAQSFAKED